MDNIVYYLAGIIIDDATIKSLEIENIYNHCQKFYLSCLYRDDGKPDRFAVGVDYENMKEQETLEQFNERSKKALLEAGLINQDANVYLISGSVYS